MYFIWSMLLCCCSPQYKAHIYSVSARCSGIMEAVWIARASLSQPYFKMCSSHLLKDDIVSPKLHTITTTICFRRGCYQETVLVCFSEAVSWLYCIQTECPASELYSKLGLCLLLYLLLNLQHVLLESLQICHLHLDPSLLAHLVLFLSLHLHQVFEERHQWRRVYAPERQSANLAVFWLEMISLCFLIAQSVNFSGKIRSSGFFD